MPGCVFHVYGTSFDPAAFLKASTLQPYDVWHCGQAVSTVGPRSSRVHEQSGVSCEVSQINDDLRGQLQDAEMFLKRYRDDLERLTALTTVEECRLDFGYVCRLSNNTAVQGEYLPVSFLTLAGQLKIAVALSLYRNSETGSDPV